jgi:hypothetical protein
MGVQSKGQGERRKIQFLRLLYDGRGLTKKRPVSDHPLDFYYTVHMHSSTNYPTVTAGGLDTTCLRRRKRKNLEKLFILVLL